MKKILSFFKWLLAVLLLLIALLYITDYDYILKGVRVVYMTGHTTAFIDDHVYFENDTINSGQPQQWPLHKAYNSVEVTEELSEVNQKLGTIAYVIIKNDSIWFEEYAEDYGTYSHTNSFSMAKSITTALMGKAIQQGKIKGLDQKITDFYPEFANAEATVGDLASMTSGMNWEESYKSPFSITARAYYDDDLAETILDQEFTQTPGEAFQYKSGNTQLLGMIIQKATGQKLADYLSVSFWKPMGMSDSAYWQLDDDENELAKAYCCIASNALDFARFGKLFKDGGSWNGKQLLDSAFVATATKPRFKGEPYGYGFWISNHMNKDIFVMRGILGQYVITIPKDNVIIVRLGHQRGTKTGNNAFTNDFYTFIEEGYTMMKNANLLK
ncbi:serine hydrolase [Gangjinia marincola]|uniref:Serine hydrolase n=1 Tax=Gangjinia marincola TaxID=578463 RepID=A0ABN1MIX5_9FLAO